jgi:hypothetical protein
LTLAYSYRYVGAPPHLARTDDDTATDLGYMRLDDQYAAVRWRVSDAETIAGQLRVLAEMMTRSNWTASPREGFKTQQQE